jgi:3-methyl-2-oxobutanoate hydroxymethyltransferase
MVKRHSRAPADLSAVGHVGPIPARETWNGAFKAVGKTAAEAIQVYQHVKAL